MDYEFIQNIGTWLQVVLVSYGAVAIFVATFLFGESGAIAGFILSASGQVSPVAVFACAFAGSLSADIFWYFVSSTVLRNVYERKIREASSEGSKMILTRLADDHTFLLLTFIKFLVGMRLFLTIYIILRKRIPFHTYLFFNSIGTLFFISVLFPVGWYLGKGISGLLFIEQGITTVLLTIVGVVMVVQLAPRAVAMVVVRATRRRARRATDRDAE